jgi:mannose-6-phosphate isomerase class I
VVRLPDGGPRIVVGLRGRACLRAGSRAAQVGGGESVFVPAGEPPVEVSGDDGATVFQAGVGIGHGAENPD